MAGPYAKDQPAGFTNCIEKVAIVGAGGKMGTHLTEHLLKTGKHVLTAIARPDSTSKFPDGVEVARVDYRGDDLSALARALKGQQFLLITMSIMAPRDTISKLIRAAAQAGVPYVLPNWFGHDPNNKTLCDDTLLSGMNDPIRAEVESLGVSSYPCGGGPNRFGFDFPKRSLVLFDGGKVAINTSTWAQCGRAVASLLSLKEFPEDESDKSPTLSQFRNRAVYIASFRLSQLDMFESVKRVTGTTDTDWTITHDSAEQRWKDSNALVLKGDFGAFTKMLYSRTWFFDGGGDYESTRGLGNKILGLPVDDLDECTAVGIGMGESGEVPFSH
ncbi:NAD(P)-binding protein [Massarina eburnea CBS 473.64]|uniref:NAD(P)-binding protein n=1 Tax=Massarina eburnea CBS 473.64 TaxID=1395130 RepID=A0A6A6RQ62_9PLEO|nr:NAD(P)-binding protein [Massarina eburnea CBS 473.64]